MEPRADDSGLMQLLPEPMLLVRGGCIIEANAAAAKLLGRAPGELEGQTLTRLLEDAAAAGAYLASCSRTRQLLPGVMSWRIGSQVQRLQCDAAALESGEGEPPLLLIRFRAEDGVVGRFVTLTEKVDGLSREIRRRQYAEDQLRTLTVTLEQKIGERTALAERRASQLRAMAMALSQAEQRERRRLAHALHDDLQQLLVAARMRAVMIADSGSLEDLRQNVQALEAAISECIALARSVTTDLSPPVLYDGGLAAGLSWLARFKAERYGLQVALRFEGDIEPPTESMRVLVFQLVRELLRNVARHAGTTAASVAVARTAAGLAIVIEDRGCGFDVAQVDAETSGRFGLLHIRERVEAIGGELRLESGPGQGTRVQMTIPMQAAETCPTCAPRNEGAKPQAAEMSLTDGRENAGMQRVIRVVLADDHSILREGIARLINSQGDLQVVGQADDGLTALELVHRERPDVIVMDITMPHLNGIEATRRVKTESPGVRVIALSMHDDAQMGAAMLAAGADAYLRKDGPVDTLLTAIRNGRGVTARSRA